MDDPGVARFQESAIYVPSDLLVTLRAAQARHFASHPQHHLSPTWRVDVGPLEPPSGDDMVKKMVLAVENACFTVASGNFTV